MMLSQKLQRLTTVVSGTVLEQIQIPNIVDGSTLFLATRRLFIEEACSGVVSLMSIVACCLILGVLLNRGLLHIVLLVLSGIALAAITNIVRIVVLAVAQERWSLDLAEGWRHDLLGLCLFVVALVLAVSTDRLLRFLFRPIETESESMTKRSVRRWDRMVTFGEPQKRDLNPKASKEEVVSKVGVAVPSFRSVPIFAMAALFLLVGVVSAQQAFVRGHAGSPASLAEVNRPKIQSLTEDSLPLQVGRWRRIGFGESQAERLFAQESRVWEYSNGRSSALFSVDFFFTRWHDLCECYRAIGWSQSEPSVVCGQGECDVYLQSRFLKGKTHEGSLCFSLIRADGAPLDPPQSLTAIEQIRRRLETDQTLFQIQLWTTAPGTLHDKDQESAEQLFRELRQAVVELMEKTLMEKRQA
jgi:exosortase/archaeosortase family protein